MSYITFRERWQNIKDDWSGAKKEIRHTAIGWRPDAGYVEDTGRTPSGNREYYQVLKGRKPKMSTIGGMVMTREQGNKILDTQNKKEGRQ